MRLATEADIPVLNSLLNRPEIRPRVWEADDKPIDATDTVRALKVLVTDDNLACFSCEALGSGRYLCATACAKEKWGLPAAIANIDAANYLMTKTDCTEILGLCNKNNPRALRMMFLLGMKYIHNEANSHDVLGIDWRFWAKNYRYPIRIGIQAAKKAGIRKISQIEAGLLGGMILCARNGFLKKAYDEYRLESVLSCGSLALPELYSNPEGQIALKLEGTESFVILE